MRLTVSTETWPLTAAFRITGHVFTHAEMIVVELQDGVHRGRGEAAGVYYRGETVESLRAQVEAARPQIEAGVDRAILRDVLPAGGARNAVDAALWDLDAARTGRSVYDLAGLPAPRRLRTTFTLSAATPEEMADAARAMPQARALKLKLTEAAPAACVEAVRRARPDIWLGVDANQGFDRATLERVLPQLAAAGVSLVEQPLPVGEDEALRGLASPIAIAADESVQDLDDLTRLAPLYDVINIKLDKCGGLTRGLAMAAQARRLGRRVMVGCMTGTSLAMAPAFVLGQVADLVDLDAPAFLARDRTPGVDYAGGDVWSPVELWGAAGRADALAGEKIR